MRRGRDGRALRASRRESFTVLRLAPPRSSDAEGASLAHRALIVGMTSTFGGLTFQPQAIEMAFPCPPHDTSRPSAATVRTGVVDANMHWLPDTLFTDPALLQAFLGAPPREYGIHARLETLPKDGLRQIVTEQPKGNDNLNYPENQYGFDEQIADMDRAQVERAVFRMPCWQEWLHLPACKLVNDQVAKHVARSPQRFSALAMVPPWGTPESQREVERCIEELGFAGVQVARWRNPHPKISALPRRPAAPAGRARCPRPAA
jgi:hypothetical protein